MTPTQTHLETLRIRTVEGRGILDVPGFRAQGVHVGLKKKRRDVCLIVSDRPTAAAGVFTQNAFAAAPVLVSRAHLADGDIRAIVCNAGNANACTGKQGLKDAEEMAAITARELGLEPHQILVSSTGIIGRPLDMDKVRRGVHECAVTMDAALGPEVAEAITTTDTTTKTVQLEIEAAGRVFHMAGIAKGSGMIHPNMATMLGFIVTDAPVDTADLQAALKRAADASFNQISVDHDESTNDTLAVLANGAEGGAVLQPGSGEWHAFEAGLTRACETLAKKIARDGEGATKLLEAQVDGAPDLKTARAAARAIVSSNLVKAAFHGGDPNWGRIVAAVGTTGVSVVPERVTVSFEAKGKTVAVLKKGVPQGAEVLAQAADVLKNGEVKVRVLLGLGKSTGVAWGCDLTTEYVTFNSAYST